LLRAARFAQPALQGRMEAAALAVSAACDRAASAVHPPLQLQTRKAEAIKVFNPRFEEDGYVKGRNYDVDRERSEARRLKKTVAREAKGAARELRKDNRFLAEERSRVRGAEASERDAKYRSEMTWLQQQEAEWKSGGQGGQGKGQKKR
jgi:nucleolar protein 14